MDRLKQGHLRHLGMLIQKVGTSPSGAPKATTYQIAVRNVWAAITPLRSMPTEENGVERQRALYHIRIRPVPVTKDMRFRKISLSADPPIDFQIETIVPELSNPPRWIDLTCARMEKAADIA